MSQVGLWRRLLATSPVIWVLVTLEFKEFYQEPQSQLSEPTLEYRHGWKD